MNSEPQCTHNYEYQGTVYWEDKQQRPGSSARDRIYADRYYCTKCLNTKMINERRHGNTYESPIAGTLPR